MATILSKYRGGCTEQGLVRISSFGPALCELHGFEFPACLLSNSMEMDPARSAASLGGPARRSLAGRRAKNNTYASSETVIRALNT